jgi:AcrR family transcriptional regulator
LSDAGRTSPNPYRRSLLRQDRSRGTRRALLRSAAKLWADQSFEATSVEEICTVAGVGRSTFYLHFESKDQLLVDLSWATTSSVAADVDAARSGGLDHQLDAFVEGVERRMESSSKQLTAAVIGAAMTENPSAAAKRTDRLQFADIVTSILQDARETGEIDPEADIAELAVVLGGMTMEAIRRWASEDPGERSLSAALRFRVDLVINAIRAGADPGKMPASVTPRNGPDRPPRGSV